MKKWQPLQAGDTVDIIAPASATSLSIIDKVKSMLDAWNLQTSIATDIFAQDFICANSDGQRFQLLKHAFYNNTSKAIWCLVGGYGSMRILPALYKLQPPKQVKLFIGMSDITVLHIVLQQNWKWNTLHASCARSLARNSITKESIQATKNIIFGKQKSITYTNLIPLNKVAIKKSIISAPIVGGNLTMIQATIGTPWQLNCKNRILLLEEINERGYRIDRMLQHLQQAKVANQAKAIIFADFIGGNEPDGGNIVTKIIQNFATCCPIPVLKCTGIGHGKINLPIPLGATSQLIVKNHNDVQLVCNSGS